MTGTVYKRVLPSGAAVTWAYSIYLGEQGEQIWKFQGGFTRADEALQEKQKNVRGENCAATERTKWHREKCHKENAIKRGLKK